jgi:hypothetical protein
MALMKEAMSKEDWERAEMGLPPIKVIKPARPEPEKPQVENQIKFEDIDAKLFAELESAKRKTVKNPEGVRFIGFDVSMLMYQKGQFGRPKEIEKGVFAPPETVSGWMIEGDFLSLLRTHRKKINSQVISW